MRLSVSDLSPVTRPTALCSRAWARLIALLALSLAIALPALAREWEATPDNYRRILRQLQAGDTLTLRSGIYRYGLPIHGLRGRADQPIVIQGPAHGQPAVLIGRPGRITISLIDSHHITLRRLIVNGKHQPAHGVVAEGRGSGTSHITLENLTLLHFDAAQSYNCVSTKAPAWFWVIRNLHLRGCGTGMYLGNSDGRASFVAGLIEGNLIEHTRGYNLQIKHQQPRPTDIGLPDTPQTTVLRYNIFNKDTHGSTGVRARPNVLLGHWPLSGAGQDDQYVVYGNVFYANANERLFQAEGNVRAFANLFINPLGEGVSFQPHNDLPRHIHFHHNTVIARGTALSLREPAHTAQQHIALNVIYSERPLTSIEPHTNLIRSFARAGHELVAPFAPLAELDVSPRTLPTLRATPEFTTPLQRQDFNGRPTALQVPGAYGHSGPQPGNFTLLARFGALCGPCRGPAPSQPATTP